MFKPFSNVLVVVFMLIAFIGQASAYTTMTCEMSLDSHQSHMKMEPSVMMHHQDMDHSDMKPSINSQSEDCCDHDCVCPASACTSVIVLNTDVDLTHRFSVSEVVAVPQTEQPKSISTSLYRPPIFA